MSIEEKLLDWLQDFIKDSELFLVSHKTKPTNNFKFFIDGDNGFSLEKSVEINRKMRRMIEEEGYFPNGDFSIEVSSPGVDEPLQLKRQYIKNTGRLVELETNNEEIGTVEGRIKEVKDESLIIETKGTKKKAKQELEINFSMINKAIIQIEFKK